MTVSLHRHATALLLGLMLIITGCHKKQPEKPKTSKRQREDAIKQSSEEQTAINAFVSAVREVMIWNQSQPVTSDAERQQTIKTLAEKMEKVPVKGLPDDLSKAWSETLKSWQALAKMAKPDASLVQQGTKAADELNRQLAARGVVGLKF